MFLEINVIILIVRGSDMISYEKLRIIMVKRKLEWKHMRRELNLTSRTINNLKDDKYVDLATLEKICLYLYLDIGEIMEIKKDQEH